MTVDDVVRVLHERTATREWGTGWQLALRTRDGSRHDLCGGVDGTGAPIRTDTRFCVYCAGKPITALCVGALVDRGELSFDDSLGDLVPGIARPALAAVTVDELLRHTAGLGGYPAHMFLAQPAAARDRMLLHLEPAVTRTHATTYSEYTAWELLRLSIEAVTDEGFEAVIDETVLGPLHLTEQLSFTLPGATIGLNVAVRGDGIEPLLWEQSDTNLTEVKASTGLIATTSALADLYLAVCPGPHRDADVPVSTATFETMVTAPAESSFDPVLDRICKLGAGFMVDLREHCFGPWQPASFGHSGLSSMTFAGCDPVRGAAFAVHVNGFLERDRAAGDRRAEQRREAVMTAVAALCGA